MKKTFTILVAALLIGVGAASGMPQKKKSRAKAPTTRTATAKSTDFTGEFVNSYSDGVGGTTTHLLSVIFDAATGTATGTHTNESGQARAFHGTLQGGALVCAYDDDGEEFATMRLLDANTLKLEGFTGTFKRSGTAAAQQVVSGEPEGAFVDPAYEQLKQHLEQQKQTQQAPGN